MEKPRVLLAYHYFAHYRRPIVEELVKSEHFDFTFVSDEKPSHASIKTLSQDDFDSGAIFANSSTARWEKVKNTWIGPILWQHGLCRKIARSDYDQVIFLGDAHFLSTWFAVLIARIRRKPSFFWSHGLYGRESWLKRKLRTAFYRLASGGMLLYGNHSRELLEAQGFDPNRLFVVFNCLDYADQLKHRKGLTPGSRIEVRAGLFKQHQHLPLAVFIGRLTPEKKLSLLIEALTKSFANGKPFNLLIIGTGSELSNLTNAVPAQLSEHVHFQGACYDESEISKFIDASDLCVSPGNIGLTAIHAMSYGTPVVTHRDAAWQGPEFEAIVEGITGSLFERNNVESLLKEISFWLFQNLADREVCRKDCLAIVDKFYNPANQARIFEAALSGIAATNVSPSQE